MRPARIHDHAVIGDCRAAALVDLEGTIDWLCWPRFDSPALFAALLDPERGGCFRIRPTTPFRAQRRYLPDTNVLETTFSGAGFEVRLLDLAPVADEAFKRRNLQPDHELLRVAACLRGEVELEVEFDPRERFGAGPALPLRQGLFGLRAADGRGELLLRSNRRLEGLASSRKDRLLLREGESLIYRLSYSREAPAVVPPIEETQEAIGRTIAWWRGWMGRLHYDGPWRDAVMRSALALKLLVYAPSGAVVAAPTTSLPERIGGEKNWDYRFCWLRDAALIVRALYGLGCGAETEAFVSWLLHSTRITRPRLGVLYDVFGEPSHGERELPLGGYRGSRPVRVGNAASRQKQLDVYGEVIDAAAIFLRSGGRVDSETAGLLLSLGRYVMEHWREPDDGIWEVRTGQVHHTHSKVMCWVALDRLLELHARGLLPRVPVERLRMVRAEIRQVVEQEGWSERLQSYVAVFGAEHVDAVLLLLGWYGFEPCGSPRMEATWRRVRAELGRGPLLHRYASQGGFDEGAFGICCFWEVDYLARAGRVEEACERFEQLLAFANDVGLYGEEIDPGTGEALGNFPQGFTHVGLINAALSVQAALLRQQEARAP